MKHIFVGILSLATLMGAAQANPNLEISTVEISEEMLMLDGSKFTSVMTEDVSDQSNDQKIDTVSVAAAGEVIQIARDLVALGEEIYVLVQKGKPNVTTQYAPISVLPREAGRSIDALDLDGWKMPISRTVTVNFKNLFGMTMAGIEYKLVFSYGGRYNGKGAYITNAQIVPSKVVAQYGVDFDVKMKLSGLTNHGSRANPVAGAMLQLQYKATTVMSNIERSDTYQITGRGQVQKL